MENPTTIAVDLSKDVFEVAVERQGRICQRKRLSRRQLVAFFCEQPAATILMEACGSSHHWGRKMQGYGHTVRLLPPQHVSRYRIGDKTDRRDCEAILEAGRRATIIAVPVKTVEQQAVCSLHRVRAALMKTRTSRLNLLRSAWVPEVLHPALVSVMEAIRELDKRVEDLERQLKALARALPLVERLETIPGVGLLNATAFSAMVGDLSRFKSSRRFAGSLGLTPKESSSGKRRWLGSISKAGNPYLRTLLIGGARSMLLAAHRAKKPHQLQEWALEVERRRGRNRAAVAVANKLARIIWAVATRGVPFRPIPVESVVVPA